MIYKQKESWPCGFYATLISLQKLGVDIDEPWIFKVFARFWKHLPSIVAWANELVRQWIIRTFTTLKTPQQVDIALRHGVYPVIYTNTLSFDSVKNPPHIQSFSGNSHHAIAIVADCGDKWKIQDSQGDKFAEWGYWYMMKKDFKKIVAPVRFFL